MGSKSNSPAPLGINAGEKVDVEDKVRDEVKKVLALKKQAEQAVKNAYLQFERDSGIKIAGVTFEHDQTDPNNPKLKQVRFHLKGE